MRARDFNLFLGVDLGGGKSKNTAVATLRALPDRSGATVAALAPRAGDAPLYDASLAELARASGRDTLLCVDAPLTLPPCLRCEVPVCPGQDACVDPAVVEMNRLAAESVAGRPGGRTARRDARRGKPDVTPYTQRATEVYLAVRRGIPPRETLGQSMGPLTGRAAHLQRLLADRFRLDENLIEVYPKATLAALGLNRRYKKHLHERENRAGILEALAGRLRFAPGVWREECVQSDHVFDAVICAYTGFLWAAEGWQLPAEASEVYRRDGWIWLPPPAEQAAREAAAE